MSKNLLLHLLILYFRRIPHIIFLLFLAVFLWASSPAPIAYAQGSNPIQNPGFETGSLSPWVKWGYPRSTVNVWRNYNHTPGGSWSGYIIPDGRYVELQQSLGVSASGPIIPNHSYDLSAWVITNGMTADVQWWSNDGRPSQECGSTSATTWVQISCTIWVPSGVTQFNVHLGGNSVQGSGQWAASDDWSLTYRDRFYAERVRNGNMYGVWALIEYANPEIREWSFSFTTINILSSTTNQNGQPLGVEVGWMKASDTNCQPKLNYSSSIFNYAPQLNGTPFVTDYRYNYMIYRVGTNLWRVKLFKEDGTVVYQPPDLNVPNFDVGNYVWVGGEVVSPTRANSMGVSGLLQLKWMDSSGAWQPWNGFNGGSIYSPYANVQIPPDTLNNVQVYGNNGNPIPPGAPCP